MSIKLMGQVWGLDVDHATRLLLLALTDHADDDGNRVYPSIALLGWKSGYEVRHVRRIMKRLRAKGCLRLVHPAGYHRPAEYRINLSVLPTQPPFKNKGDKMSPYQAGRVTLGVRKGDICDLMGDTQTPRTISYEPSKTESVALHAENNGKGGGLGLHKDLVPPEWQGEFESGAAEVAACRREKAVRR